MAPCIPITLLGDNLGQRHRYLNSIVREAKASGPSFQEIDALPEQSPVDRLFKIDLAAKLKNVEYIIRNLKDDDMLYVSRALKKSTWLLDHRDIINPKYLEDHLFPEMVTTAVSKMKHWLYINLRDPATCQEFYQYYRDDTFQFALKFLSHCSQEFILNEVPNILTKLTPHYLKVLSEKCPKVAKIFFDSLETDEDVRTQYLNQEQSYYNSVKCVLKSDADVFLDITERYFNVNSLSRFSPSATDYIMRCHKSRFTNKLELYVAYLLHIPSLATHLSVEECQEVVIKLARANYLQYWFQYKVVEPLIKRLSPDKRAAFKKIIFIQKDFGDQVDDWPYETCRPPMHTDSDQHIFDDQDLASINFAPWGYALRAEEFSRCCAFKSDYCEADDCIIRMKSDLDKLFDEFRFIGFEHALRELGQRLGATGSADRRRDIFLVLVSKSGGRSDALEALLRLAARHSNEPAHTRASVLRSLVKRANVWRLPADIWQYLLDFGHGLGLDGSTPEAACREGLHAVVIRQLLAGQCDPAVSTAFLNDFSTLADYSLKGDERAHIAKRLQNMLETSAVDVEPALAVQRLNQLLDVLKIYHIRVEPGSPAIKAVMALASRDPEIARPLLEQFYNARVGRRELFSVNLKCRQDEATLVNALRHDPFALEITRIVDILAASPSRFDGFMLKLVVYFQTDDFTTQLRKALKNKLTQEKNTKLARPIVSLMGNDLTKELNELDAAGTEYIKLAAALRACAHCARPLVNLADWGWHKAGVKAVATRAICCPEIQRAEIARALAGERRTVRVALALSMRSKGGLLIQTFETAAKLRPAAALRAAMLYFHRHNDSADRKVWDIIKPILSSIDLISRKRLRGLLENTAWIPSNIKADYCTTLYFVINKISNSNAERVLLDLSKLLPLCDKSIENILLHLLENTDKDVPAIPIPAMFVRYLMLSKNDEEFEERFVKIGDRFLKRLETLRCEKDSRFEARLNQIMQSLKYNAAFLDTKYTSCLSVIGRILAWIEKFMPKEKYFKEYVHIHLTMLFYKAVRQIMKQMPEVLADPKRRKFEGADAVGYVFGRYIGKEVAELVSTYFDSIIELYTDALADYLGDYFVYGSSRSKLLGSMLKGMLAEGVGNQRRLAVYVLSKRRYILEDSLRNEIEGLMAKDETLSFFIYATLLT